MQLENVDLKAKAAMGKLDTARSHQPDDGSLGPTSKKDNHSI